MRSRIPLKPWASRRREEMFKVRDDVEWADRSARPSRGGSGREEREGQTADDTAGRWAHYFHGVPTNNGRCESISAREAGGKLSGADSAGVQFGWTSTTGVDQQAGESVP